jgi:adenine-specific DNA-methyltransferase
MVLKQAIWQGPSEELCLRFREKRNVAAVITDPPFGVDNQSNQAVTNEGKKAARKIANDESPEVAIRVFKDVMQALLPATKDDAHLIVFTSYQVLSDWLVMTDDFLPGFGFKRKAIGIWEKDGPGMGDTDYPFGMGCEFFLCFEKGRKGKGDFTRRNSVIRVPQLRPNQLIHPHEKPEGLIELLLKATTKKGELAVDPFGGSGVLARAARNTERSGVSIELDEFNASEAQKKFDAKAGGLF